ncbi:MAG: type II secretion system inner membrane protein GspF [Myxococcota bacterium]|nr:type II secretion system inner membrane protein GspF [Myxococcota bacterium]MDW8360816.1 type II secretion system inner membrane protein GspF [Myxococcales bacterium]
MAVFAWRGIGPTGRSVRGVRDAESPRALRATLRREGILVTEVLEAEAARQRRRREVDLRRLVRAFSRPRAELAVTTRQLATLLRSGVPLVEALGALIEQIEQPELGAALTQVRDRVNEGSSLADAMRAHPAIFSPLYVSMVAAGEASGTLEVVLGRLADFLDAQSRLTSKVLAAIAYPAFMAAMSVVILSIMMVVVVPKVTAIFADFEQALPWYTRLLIFTSDVLTGWWWLLLGLLVGAIAWFRRWKRSPEGRRRWDRFVLRVPQIGTLVVMVALARFARTLATLLRSGVPVLRAMEITRDVLGNTELMRVVDEARESVREGESIAAPLRRSGRFPPIVTHMIAVGERSGQLEEMLEHVAAAYDAQVEARLTAMTSLLEPLLIVIMGGASGAIAFSILMPLLQINEFIG